MDDWIKIPPGNAWGDVLGHSRLVRTASSVYVSGTGPIAPDGILLGGACAYEQTKATIDNIVHSLESAGVEPDKVVRIRVYVKSFSYIQDVARGLREGFKNVRPACTLLGVSELFDPNVLVYMDADASLV